MSKRDCLGRTIPEIDDSDPPHNRRLSDAAITAIAVDVRTRPLTEVGRHVMPLIQHACELEDQLAAANARAEKAERERDTITRLCYLPLAEGKEHRSYSLMVTPPEGAVQFYKTEAEVVAAVRKAAGLEQDQ